MSWDSVANCWERVLVSIGVLWERLLVSVGGYWHAAVGYIPDAAFWEKASKFAPVVTASIAALAAFFAWLSIRAQRDTARRRAAIDFFLKTDVDEKTIDLYTKFKRAVRGLEARTSFDDFVGEQEYQDLRAFLNICELIAVGIKQKAFSDSVSFAYWGGVLPRSYRDAEVLIKYIRNAPREGTPHTYVDLERLCKKWSKRGAWRKRLALQHAPNNGYRQFSKRLRRSYSPGDHSPGARRPQSVSLDQTSPPVVPASPPAGRRPAKIASTMSGASKVRQDGASDLGPGDVLCCSNLSDSGVHAVHQSFPLPAVVEMPKRAKRSCAPARD